MTCAAIAVVALFGNPDIGFTEIIVVAGILGFLLDRLVESRGWSKSSKTLRRENEDLIRRNGELEDAIARHQATIDELRAALKALEGKVGDLEKHDLASVMRSLETHEVAAERRSVQLQTDAAARHAEHIRIASDQTRVLSEINQTLREGGTPRT